MKKINILGLSPEFNGDAATKELLKQMMALCLIPAEFIRGRFAALASKCITPKLEAFAEYMRATWVENSFMPPEMWSVYNCRTRTNNALEGIVGYVFHNYIII